MVTKKKIHVNNSNDDNSSNVPVIQRGQIMVSL